MFILFDGRIWIKINLFEMHVVTADEGHRNDK